MVKKLLVTDLDKDTGRDTKITTLQKQGQCRIHCSELLCSAYHVVKKLLVMILDKDTGADTKSPHYRNRDNAEYIIVYFCVLHTMWLKNYL